MAVTDWTRTELEMRLPSGALALRFDMVDAAIFDLFILRREGAERDYSDDVLRLAQERQVDRERLARTILMGLPGTVKDLTVEEFRSRLATYDGIDSDQLHANHAAFLRDVIPVAEEVDVDLAIHPDDPPFPLFGLPRIACTESDLKRIVDAVDSRVNGITFCTGSLGSHPENDLPGILRRLGDRIHFLHFRSVRREPYGSFYEDDHLAGSSDMVAIMREAIALADHRGEAIPMRPDHGHLIEGDDARAYPGYSYVGRLRGLAELRGLELGLRAG
jgi:mannonate dehydratase